MLRDEGDRLLPLIGMQGNEVRVGSASAPRTVRRGEVEDHWLGEYVLAWPQAPDWPPEIRRGESGPAVGIVTQMATLANPPWRGEALFDAAFEAWVLDFQSRRGLEADGIIGPQTLVHLIAPTITEPRLDVGSEEED